MFILRYPQHSACTSKPNNLSRLHAAFIGCKWAKALWANVSPFPWCREWFHCLRGFSFSFLFFCIWAYNNIPRNSLWSHSHHIRKPVSLLSTLDSLHAQLDGNKSARVKPAVGVKEGCHLCSLLVSFYINGIGMIAEGVQRCSHQVKGCACHTLAVCWWPDSATS